MVDENPVAPMNYNVAIGHPNGQSMAFFTTSEKDLVGEYKDAVMNKSKFLSWENGCFEMKNVLGVFRG